LIWNIIDRREHQYRWKRINAIIEATWHDNSRKNSDQAEVDDNAVAYDARTGISLAEAIAWATANPYPVTLYLWDEGRGTSVRRS
jgi:hypothetical protein